MLFLRRLALLSCFLSVVILAAACTGVALPDEPPQPRATPTAEPLIPTPLPADGATLPGEATPTGIATLENVSTESAPTKTAPPITPSGLSASGSDSRFPLGGPARTRVGLGFAIGMIDEYEWGEGAPGWWLNWRVEPDPPQVTDSRFAQMVRFHADGFKPEEATLAAVARTHPGSLWLLGNEPDVTWQDNATPEQYAATYGRLYPVIKEADPTALIAIGGVSQPTPLRLAYLDRILAAYREQFGAEMPVDVWNIHAFILREERDSWGVGIPPGMAEDTGRLYEISDHADLELFRAQIVDFRRWMAERGFRDKPLVVSEYGILMPESYGFPPDLVAGFMADTFDYFLTATDPALGYAPDANRLVQAFCWYSNSDTVYPTPSLFHPETKAITPVGEMFTAYVAGLAGSE